MLHYVVERLRAAPADEIRVVTRPEKRDIVEEANALGLSIVAATPETLALSVYAGIDGLADDDVVLLGFPDSVWDPVDGFRQLLTVLEDGTAVVLGLFRSDEPQRGDVVQLRGDVAGVHVKSPDPPGDLIWGIAAAGAGTLRRLRDYREPGHLFDELARAGLVRSVRFPGEFIDIGTKEALERARALLGK